MAAQHHDTFQAVMRSMEHPSDDTRGWNDRFLEALDRHDLRLMPLAEAEARGLMGRPDSPMQAPWPQRDWQDDPRYPFLSVVVAKDMR